MKITLSQEELAQAAAEYLARHRKLISTSYQFEATREGGFFGSGKANVQCHLTAEPEPAPAVVIEKPAELDV